MRILPYVATGLLMGLLGQPVLAYRALQWNNLVATNTQVPVSIVGVSSSLQDTNSRLNNTWDTTLTLRRELDKDDRPIQSVDVEIKLLGSQGDTLETLVMPILINAFWQNQTTREIRLQRAYLGWPATAVQARILKINYVEEKNQTTPAPTQLAVEPVNEDTEEINISTDSPYIQPMMLSPGGGGSSNNGLPRPVRPRPTRPVRPNLTAVPTPQSNPGATISPNNIPTNGSFAPRPSLFNSTPPATTPAKPAKPPQQLEENEN
jgi:hypothetical protein